MSKSTVISAVTALAVASLSTLTITTSATATPSVPSYISSIGSSGSSVSIDSSVPTGSSSNQTPGDQPGENVESPVFRAVAGAGKDGNSVNFNWRTTYEGEEFVRFAPEDKPKEAKQIAAQEEDDGVSDYRSNFAEVSDLQAGVTYTYQLGSNEGGWSDPESFTIDDGDDTWEFIAVSDAQVGVHKRGEDSDQVRDEKLAKQAQNWRETIAAAAKKSPDASLALSMGDQVEGWGDLNDEYNAFFSAPELRKYRTAVIEGNHELYPNDSDDLDVVGTQHFKEHFKLPNEVGKSSNYFFEQNNALILGLNSNRQSDAELAETAQFVRDTVAEHGADKDWIIVASHFAYYSQGHRYNNDEIKRMRKALGPVFSEVGVDLVLNGHDHMYNRSHLINGVDPVIPEEYAAPGDVLEPKDGDVLYVTLTSAGGGKFYGFTPSRRITKPEQEKIDRAGGINLQVSRERELVHPTIGLWNQDDTTDYSVVNVTGDTLQIRTYNVDDDSLVDDVTIKNPREKKSEEAPSDNASDVASSFSSKASSGSSLGKSSRDS